MTQKVLAITKDGRLTYCSADPDKRGMGRCNHVAHREEGQSVEEFISIYTIKEGVTPEEVEREFLDENKAGWNNPVNWEESLSGEEIDSFINIPSEPNLHGRCTCETTTNEYGDVVDKLTLVFENPDDPNSPYYCDFGEVPHINEDGTFTIMGVEYVDIPVIDKHKIGYCQYYNSNGEKALTLLQKDGNVGVTFILGSDKCKIFGKEYDAARIEQDFINGYSDDPKVNSLIQTLDQDMIRERFPEFGQEGWLSKMQEGWTKDEINDISYRRVHTFEDQVKQEHLMQLRRMGVTFRKNYIDSEGKKMVFMQTMNTDNIRSNLIGRSNVQLADRTNPISLFSQTHKLTLVGREGFNKDDCPEELRDVHPSMKGVVDNLDQSSGKGIGLTFFAKNLDLSGNCIRPGGTPDALSTSDFVPFRLHSNPNRVSMACSQLRQVVPVSGGEDPLLLGDPSDKAWLKIRGSKMGINARVAYIPSDGVWEDSCVISESMAKKMSYKKTYRFPYDRKLAKANGRQVKIGDEIGGVKVKNPGVLRVEPTPEGGKSLYMYVDSDVSFSIGDKLTNREGAKGTVGRIIPDNQMPKVFDTRTRKYVPAEVIMSPLSTGKRGNINAFMEASQTMDKTKPVVLADGHTVEGNTNGSVFIMRLNQNASEKTNVNVQKLNSAGNATSERAAGEMNLIVNSTTDTRRSIVQGFREDVPNKEYLKDNLRAIGVKFEEV